MDTMRCRWMEKAPKPVAFASRRYCRGGKLRLAAIAEDRSLSSEELVSGLGNGVFFVPEASAAVVESCATASAAQLCQ